MSVDAGTAYIRFKGDWAGLTREVASRAQLAGRDYGGHFGKAMKPVMAQQSKHLRTFTNALKYASVGAAGLAAYGLKDVIEAGSKFEKQMDTNAAISEANRRQMGLLEKQALKLGKATFFSANQAGEAQAELAKGGLQVQQILSGGLPAALSLAEAGELDLAVAAETTVNAMKLFGIGGKGATQVADMLSTAANRTTADVLDFAMALKQGGSVSKLAGYDLNETVTILEALAEAGIKNSDAGTSMKTATIQLLKPSKKQAELAKELNLEFVNQAGHLKGAVGLSEELRRATDGMTKAERAKTFATLAGTDGVRTLNALYEEGPKALQGLEKANARQGVAQELARKKMDNVAGSIEQLKGSVETAEIAIFQGMAPALGTLTDEATKAANEVGAVFEDPTLTSGAKVEKAIEVLSDELGGMWDRNEMTDHLVDVVDAAIPIVAEHAGRLGLEAAEGFGKGFFHADLLGKAAMAAWLVHFTAGNAPFLAAGKLMAGQFSSAFATQAGEQSIYELSRSFGRGRAASSLAQSGAFAQSAALAARSYASSFARYAGPALATVGVANIATSAISGDWKDAGFEAGGAIAGGIAGFLLSGGNPLGAMIGVGLGSIGGELGADLFDGIFDSGKRLNPLQQRLAAESQHVAEAFRHQHSAVKGLASAHANLRDAEQRQKASTRAVHQAEARLSADRKKYGADSNRVKRDELLLAEAKRKNAKATREVNQAHHLSGPALKLFNHLTIEAAAATKVHIADLKRDFQAAYRKFKQDESNAAAAKRAQRILGELTGEQRKLSHLYEEAGSKSGKHLQARIENLTLSQAKFGARLQGVTRLLPDFGNKSKHWVADVGGGAWLDYRGNVHKATKLTSEDAVSMSKTSRDAMEALAQTTSRLLKHFGADGSGFAVSKGGGGGEQKRQAGGFIVPGTGSGDTFRTALPPGSFIENREAVRAALAFAKGGLMPVALEPGERVYLPPEVKAIGQDTLEARNKAVPRFQKGGPLGRPVLAGPDGALRDLGQAAIDQVYKGAEAYIAKHRPKGLAGVGGSVKDHPELQAGISAIVATVLKRYPGLSITSTTGGGHAENSLHYEGRAADLAAGSGYMLKAAAWIHSKLGPLLTEGIHNPNLSVKYGKDVGPGYWGPEVWADHLDHIHLGKQRGGLIQALAEGGRVVTGKVSWFNESENPGQGTASGLRTSHPGLALNLHPGTESGWNNSTTKGWIDAARAGHPVYGDTSIGGKNANLPIIDLGPAASTGRAIDVTEGGVRKLGFTTSNFPTDAIGKAIVEGGGGQLTEGLQRAAEGKRRKANYESTLEKLRQRVAASKTDLGKRSALWKLMKFWGRVGIFDKDERGHILEAVQRAAAQANPEGAVKVLSHLAAYSREHGEITGRDPDNAHSLVDAIEKAQERGQKQREKVVEKLKKRRERKAQRIAGRGEFPGLAEMLKGKEGAYDLANQMAERLVALEPENISDEYVGQERGAWGGVLDRLSEWRDSVVGAHDFAGGRISGWEEQIEKIKSLKGDAFQKNKWRIKPLREAITNAKGFIGERATELQDLQGFGGPQGKIGSVGEGTPWWLTLGGPGARIFDTQNTIRELGTKATSSGGESDSERSSLLETLLLQANQRTAVSEAAFATLRDWDAMREAMPKFHGGGKILSGPQRLGPLTREVPIMAEVGESVLSESQTKALEGLGSPSNSGTGSTVVQIDQLIVHPDGSATAKTGSQELTASIRKVIRQDPALRLR